MSALCETKNKIQFPYIIYCGHLNFTSLQYFVKEGLSYEEEWENGLLNKRDVYLNKQLLLEDTIVVKLSDKLYKSFTWEEFILIFNRISERR